MTTVSERPREARIAWERRDPDVELEDDEGLGDLSINNDGECERRDGGVEVDAIATVEPYPSEVHGRCGEADGNAPALTGGLGRGRGPAGELAIDIMLEPWVETAEIEGVGGNGEPGEEDALDIAAA